MIYMEKSDGRGKGWGRVFSTTDSQRELEKFRCAVRAPRQALHIRSAKDDRIHLLLCGKPREVSSLMIPANLVFNSPVDRVLWERNQPEVTKRHPVPFMERL